MELYIQMMKMFWNQIDVLVPQHCESSKCHFIVPVKMINFMLREFYIN